MASPVGGLVCFKLLQEGMRLLFVEKDTELHQLPLDVNLLWAGLDTNYADQQYRDPWGARPIAARLSREEGAAVQIWMDRSLSMFGRAPDFVVDIDRELSDQQLKDIINSKAPFRPMCIRPFEDEGLWSQGWLGIKNGENVHPELSPSICIYGFCPQETIDDLLSKMKLKNPLPTSEDLLMCWTDDLVSILNYVTYNGKTVKLMDLDIDSNLSDVSGDRCRLVIDSCRLLDQKPKSKIEERDPSKGSSMEGTVDGMDLDGYVSSDSDFVNNGTFDAVLQKSKDYPIDWWQGGSECRLAFDDINCKAMARAAVRCTVRWLLLGYLVVAFAVPKALGWEGL